MNKMVISGVNNQVFIASNLARVEHFYTVLLGLPVVKRTVHHLDPRLPVVTFGFQSIQRGSRSGDTPSATSNGILVLHDAGSRVC